ncbi:MAG: hypothetical protein AB4041_16730 [Microcystaceae cyanobacterium]
MEIEQIRIKIERALVDGRLSRQESMDIKIALYSKKPITPEAVKLFRELQEKIWRGEIRLGD